MSNRFAVPDTTLSDKLTFIYRHAWRKHGPFLSEADSEDSYVEAKVNALTRFEFLEALSSALAEMTEAAPSVTEAKEMFS